MVSQERERLDQLLKNKDALSKELEERNKIGDPITMEKCLTRTTTY